MELRLGENGLYNLIIIQKMHVSLLTPLSLGRYLIKKDTIYLRDSAAATSFLGVIKNNEIHFLTGYSIMKSQKLKFDKPNTQIVNFLNLYIDPDTIVMRLSKELRMSFSKLLKQEAFSLTVNRQ